MTDRNTDPPEANQAPSEIPCTQVSAALCAAGRCVAIANYGVLPTGVSLCASDGHWHTRIDGGLDPPPGSSIATELLLAGAAARALGDDDENPDMGMIAELGLAMIRLQDKSGPPFLAAMTLIERHEPVVRGIAGELMRKHRINARRLRAHLRPVLQAVGGRDGR
jgi:hypothetical protein